MLYTFYMSKKFEVFQDPDMYNAEDGLDWFWQDLRDEHNGTVIIGPFLCEDDAKHSAQIHVGRNRRANP